MDSKKIFPGGEGNCRFILIGGFLGAGKTTLIGLLSRWLEERLSRVGLITNDQGIGLIDTATAQRSVGKEQVREITGGCFCCRLDHLVAAVGQLQADSRPDVIIAEPVGSCTDLLSTVILPLERVYRVPLALAPLSVILDARRALASLGGKRTERDLHRDVGYVFRKQIEEAEWLVVNKTDLMNEVELADLLDRLRKQHPSKRLFAVSARTGCGLESWFQAMIEEESAPRTLMELDYQRYAAGEAKLGWFNSEAECRMVDGGGSWGSWLDECGRRISALLDEECGDIGHFKMSVESDGRRWRFHQVMTGEEPILIEEQASEAQELVESANGMGIPDKRGRPSLEPSGSRSVGRLLVNLRAEGEARRLEAIVQRAFSEQEEVVLTVRDRAAFQPGEPRPTHRLTALADGVG